MKTDRTKLQDTLEGMYDPAGLLIHEGTSEELKTDVAKGPNSVDSKGLNCQDCKTRVHINKQNPDVTKDVADGVHVDMGDFDDLVVQVPQMQIVEKLSRSHNCRLFVTPETIMQLKNHAVVHVVDRLQGGGRKGQKKRDKGETSSSESDAFADMFLELLRKDSRQGNSFFQSLTQVDEGVAQETIDKVKQAIAAEAESFGIRDLSRW